MRFVISGASNPELFLPWELIDRFLSATDGSTPLGERTRAQYEDDIVAFGWSTVSFWKEWDGLSADYRAVMHRSRRLVAVMPTRGYPEAGLEQSADTTTQSSQERADPGYLRRALCFRRAEALERARAKFGGILFDRFLYQVVAPKVTVLADEPMTATELRHLARGCQ